MYFLLEKWDFCPKKDIVIDMDFKNKLDEAVTANNSLLCVGLDPDISKMPEFIANGAEPLFTFNKAIIDATADLVCAYKPNSAMYEATGAAGVKQLKATCDYINKNYPNIPIILDFKRGDIGNTNNYYASFAFDYLGVGAVTIHPYMGKEANKEYLVYKEKGIIVLCRTSNQGAGEFQDLQVNDLPLYKHVAKNVMTDWNINNNCLLVVGATFAAELGEVRKLVGQDAIFLVPGVGAQGGDIQRILKAGIGANKRGLIINSARDILYSSFGADFANSASEKALKTRNEINKYR